MGLKYRSKIDFASIVNSDREGANLGVDSSIFIREEASRGVFAVPRIGTQGSSIGDIGAVDDIAALPGVNFKVVVDGGALVNCTTTNAGKTTGAAIAAHLESVINTALAADGQDARVWAQFDIADDHYEIYSQSTGVGSSVVITNGATNNLADDLKLGLANGGDEVVGVVDQDYLLYTEGGAKFEQPIEASPHRTERYHSGFIRKKVNCSFDITTMINMAGSAGASIDPAIAVLLKSSFGKQTLVGGLEMIYEQDIPTTYFSLVRASTIFAEYFTGGYVKEYALAVPGDAPGTQKFSGRLANGAIAGIGIIDGGVVASDAIVLQNTPIKHVERFTVGAPVMVVAADGRTITAGFDGGLFITTEIQGTDTLVLSAAVDAEDGGFLVFWHPGAVGTTARDNIYTDLYGSFKFNSTDPSVCVTNISLTCNNDHVDRDNCFGSQGNEGFVPANKMTMTLECTLDLSGVNLGSLVQARKFGGFTPQILIGDGVGRSLLISAPKWVVSVPAIDLPATGVTPVTFTGNLYESTPGGRDPIILEFV